MSSKPTPVLIVKGNGIGNFSVPRDNIEWIKWIWYHMLPLLVAQYYPDNSRIRVVLAISNPDIDHWNGITDIDLMLKIKVLSKGYEYKERICEMYSEIHNCR